MNEAELVYSHVLNCDRLSLYLNKDNCLDKHRSLEASKIFKRRILGQPLQYILGSCEFMGWEFKVDRRALIPRPETEILVGCALKKLQLNTGAVPPAILDLGTGSGCIAVSIAKILPKARIWATDISAQALQLAKDNAAAHKVKIRFLRSDIFQVFKKKKIKFDLIISNPPYIARNEFYGLSREISFEPVLALEAGEDGLDFYRRIISQAAAYLNAGGWLIFELGINQDQQVCAMLKAGGFEVVDVVKDYNNINRVVIAKQRIFKNG